MHVAELLMMNEMPSVKRYWGRARGGGQARKGVRVRIYPKIVIRR